MIRSFTFDYEVVPWMAQGNCTDPSIDPNWFFPDGNVEKSIEVKLALNICSTCPVQFQCLRYAIDNYPLDGIWGGLKPREIKELAKKRIKNERTNNN